MSDYTPTTEQVRDEYRFSNKRPDVCGKDFGAEFDRWLNSERARIWDEGYRQGRSDQADHSMYHQTHTDNPYRSAP